MDRDDLIGQRVTWQGESWFVAVAQHDTEEGDDVGHWHLTLTAPERIKRKRCGHDPNVSVAGCRVCAATFVAGVAANLGVEPPAETKRVLDA